MISDGLEGGAFGGVRRVPRISYLEPRPSAMRSVCEGGLFRVRALEALVALVAVGQNISKPIIFFFHAV